MTGTEIYNKILALLDVYSQGGTPIAAVENADIENKTIFFIDMAQKEWWKQSKVTDQVIITNKPPINLIDNTDAILDFSETTYLPSQLGLGGVGSYSIQVNEEANSNAQITLQQQTGATWTDVVIYTPTDIEGFHTYKGNTGTTDPVRLKLTGTNHFLHKNRAMYEYSYNTVPTYEQWVKYSLPTNFNGVDAVIEEYPCGNYAQGNNYKLENYRDFYYNFNFEGEIRITYKPIAPTFTALTDTIFIDDVLAQNIVYDVVAKLGFYENPDLVNWAESKALEGKQMAVTNTSSAYIMTNYYG